MKPVILSAQAEADLVDISLYIARDNPVRAMTFVDEIEAKAMTLADTPMKGAARDDLNPGIRLLVHGAYGVYYRVTNENIRILRVLHSARDLSVDDFET